MKEVSIIGVDLKVRHPGDPVMTISHETICKSLFIQARGALMKELLARLRSRRIPPRGRTATTAGQTRGKSWMLSRSGIALRHNTRSRKMLGFQTPADTFERAVALTR